MPQLKKILTATFLLVLIAGAAAGYTFYRWANAPLRFSQAHLDAAVKPRSSLRGVSNQLAHAGVPIEPRLFVALTRVLGLSAQLKAGDYEFQSGITPYEMLQKVARGDVDQYLVTVIDGWNFRQMRAALDSNPAVRHDTAGWSNEALLKALGVTGSNPEGLFYPDTYLFDKGTSDLDLYGRAYRLMQERVAQAWAARAPNLPYRSPYDALIMASLVEKESGQAAEQPMVAAVFVNRLKLHMPLQTDPSVIYGIGPQYSGRLHKKDLQTDNPYNTYTRLGLPPTPIDLPGSAALEAALNPAPSTALYFVARGDGYSVFSNTLEAHNRAVNKYIRGE
jgi:UPF0755 protein